MLVGLWPPFCDFWRAKVLVGRSPTFWNGPTQASPPHMTLPAGPFGRTALPVPVRLPQG